MALGQQRPLVNRGADKVGQFVLGIFNACNMQVTRKATLIAGTEIDLTDLGRSMRPGAKKSDGHDVRVFGADKGQQKVQRRVTFLGLKQA